TFHRLDKVLALAIRSAGVDDDNAARSDDKGDVRDASAILRRNLAATARQNVHACGDHKGRRLGGAQGLRSTCRIQNSDDRVQEVGYRDRRRTHENQKVCELSQLDASLWERAMWPQGCRFEQGLYVVGCKRFGPSCGVKNAPTHARLCLCNAA